MEPIAANEIDVALFREIDVARQIETRWAPAVVVAIEKAGIRARRADAYQVIHEMATDRVRLIREAFRKVFRLRGQENLRGANGRRHEVDFGDDLVTVDVAISATTIQITMMATDRGDLARDRYVTVALPREGLAAALAATAGRLDVNGELGLRLVGEE